MSGYMEWVLIFFMLYIFFSVWIFTNMLERIEWMLKKMEERFREGR